MSEPNSTSPQAVEAAPAKPIGDDVLVIVPVRNVVVFPGAVAQVR